MENGLATVHPELVSEWSEKNDPLTPDKITYGLNKVVWWKGACGHEWQTSVKARSKGEKCPICSGARVVEGVNDLETLMSELAREWSERNYPLLPTMVVSFANKKVWWKCDKGHEWNTLIATRSGGSKCPYCSGILLLKGFNDLATTRPEIAGEWSERNLPLTPDKINEKFRKNVWWKGSCGHSWKARISERMIEGMGCTVCEKEYQCMFPRLVVGFYGRKKGLKVLVDSDAVIGLPLETYMPDEKLAIETTVESEKIELLKEHMCKQKGIKLVKVPYKRNDDEAGFARKIKNVFRGVHIYISSDEEEDVAFIRKQFDEWRERK